MTPKEALKGRKVFIYARVSTEEQEGTLPTQISAVKKSLKALGFKGQPTIYQEQISGATIDRPELLKMIEAAKASKRPAVIVVRDVQRFSRDPYDLGELYNPLRRLEIPILALNDNIVLGTEKMPDPNADLLAPILVAAGGSEISIRKKQSAQGIEESRKRGIFGGTPTDVFAKEPLSPHAELWRIIDKGAYAQTYATNRIGKSSSWIRKWYAKMADWKKRGGKAKVEEYLKVVELLRDLEKKHGKRFGKDATKRMQSVGRMTSGYMDDPFAWLPPTQMDLDEYYKNWTLYKKKR